MQSERVGKARSARSDRFARRRQLRKITSIRRVRNCGLPLSSESGPTVGVVNNPDGTRTAGFGGLATCGSVWACPQCAAKVATRRADELATVMHTVDELGGSAFMWTGTMRHWAGDRLGLPRDDRRRIGVLEERLADVHVAEANGWDVDERQAEADAVELDTLRGRRGCWDVAGDAWAKVTSGAAWSKDQDACGGLLGWARVVETTDGTHGWHVHVHALLCFADDVSADLVAAGIGARMFSRWQGELLRQGFDASEAHGWDLRKVQLGDGDLANYFTKIAHEVTGSHRKEGRRAGGRTPMQVLADAVDTYEEGNLARWWEWEAASEGRRQLTWSTGRRSLRRLAGFGTEATDEEIAHEDLDADRRVGLPSDTWSWITAGHHESDVLNVTEAGGLDGLRAWLRLHGLGWTEATSPPRPAGGDGSTMAGMRTHDRYFYSRGPSA